jgi:penicillin amidase
MKLAPFLTLALIFSIISCNSNQDNEFTFNQLTADVEVLRDQWGINHIYAKNQNDMFFAQGYLAARDRLFQFEIWRRQATGTVAEILGEREIKRDIGTRLFKYRGNLKQELGHYHSEGESIINAYVNGVNAYITESLLKEDELPLEFKLLGIKPGLWTPEVVISRHQGLLGNINQELNHGMAVAKIGVDKVKQLNWFHPKEPDIKLDTAINPNLLTEKILDLYKAFRKPVRFEAADLVNHETQTHTAYNHLLNPPDHELDGSGGDWSSIGSNNWVLNGDKTESGYPIMANDPHRTIAVPSLRYMVHLVAPGWNVIGGGEPEIPGVSIGHNEHGAWGLTVFRTDGEDLYVYDLNPDNLNQYKYNGHWEDMEVVKETIKVLNHAEINIDLRYTRHGPVTYIDSVHSKAYAVRCAWLEPGGAPYLASLRMDQAATWEEFRAACNYSNIPGENMIWADSEGNIGWQAVGIAPLRRNFSGLVPVPGDGRFEWDGYLPIIQKPNILNPAENFFSSANQNITPENYPEWDAIGYSWSDPYRGDRVKEVLTAKERLSMEDMMLLQTDYLSIPARVLIPFLKNIKFSNDQVSSARRQLLSWDYSLDANSIPAAIYVAWENAIRQEAARQFIPREAKGLIALQLTRIISWIEEPELIFPAPAEQNRDSFLQLTFSTAVDNLTKTLGEDMSGWQYGQEKYKHITINHALGLLVDPNLQGKINLGPLPRGGNGYTPGSTSSNLNQSSGASFRIIVDTGDWDATMGTNTPGQSGDPASAFYDNLFEPWALDQYFPVYFSRSRIEGTTVSTIILKADN